MSLPDAVERIEVELDADWPPCDYCGSASRYAKATMAHRHVGFHCGGCDARKNWLNDNGTSGLWIPHKEFWPGGRFQDTIPAHFLGKPKSQNKDRELDINERRKDWIHNEQQACASCSTPPLRDSHDRGKLLTWLKDWHADLFREAMLWVNARDPRPKMSTWFDALHADKEFSMIAAIRERVRTSILQAEHTIPRAVMALLWTTWDADMRAMATGTLAFGFCRSCNTGKHNRLPTDAEIRRRYVQLNYDGNERAARAAAASWQSLERLIVSIEKHRSQISVQDDVAAAQ